MREIGVATGRGDLYRFSFKALTLFKIGGIILAIERDILITEVALRDGSHAVNHQFTVEQVLTVAKALNDANVPYIEVTHGDGLAGSSLQYGLSLNR